MNKFFGFNTTRTPSLNSVKNSHFGDTRFIIGRGNNFSISSILIYNVLFKQNSPRYSVYLITYIRDVTSLLGCIVSKSSLGLYLINSLKTISNKL